MSGYFHTGNKKKFQEELDLYFRPQIKCMNSTRADRVVVPRTNKSVVRTMDKLYRLEQRRQTLGTGNNKKYFRRVGITSGI